MYEEEECGLRVCGFGCVCRPEFVDSSLVDPETRTFNRAFFLAFLDELNRISSLKAVALQQLQAFNKSADKERLPALSPLAMLNQLVAQRKIKPHPPPSSSSSLPASCFSPSSVSIQDAMEVRGAEDFSKEGQMTKRFRQEPAGRDEDGENEVEENEVLKVSVGTRES